MRRSAPRTERRPQTPRLDNKNKQGALLCSLPRPLWRWPLHGHWRQPSAPMASDHCPAIALHCGCLPEMAGRPAPKWLQVRRCGALEPCRESQYSPRPRKSGLKKSPDEKPDPRANLSRPGQVTRRPKISRKHSRPAVSLQLDGSFLLFFGLGSALAKSNKADRSDGFLQQRKKAPHQSVKPKKRGTTYLGATE